MAFATTHLVEVGTKNLPELNQPRYFAGSAVDRDGNWYVFGGTDNAGRSVPSTEVYDRQNDEWIMLDSRFDLGDTSVLPLRPARSWPRGDFRGGELFAFGGHRNEQSGDTVLGLVEKVRILPPINTIHMPIISKEDISSRRNSTFDTADPIPLNKVISSGFADALDFADMFYVNINSPRPLSVKIQKIPSGADYDLKVYNSNKGLLGQSSRPGNNSETVNLNVSPGRIYIVVERILPVKGATPNPEPYQLLVQG